MKKNIFLFLGIVPCCIPHLSSTAKIFPQQNNTLHSIPIGKYKACKWVDDEVTGMTYEEANKLLSQTMVIDSLEFKIFNNVLLRVKYELTYVNKTEYLRQYRAKDERLKINNDSINILTVRTPDTDPNPPIEIIVTDDYLIANHDGFFYFFKKDCK